MDFSQAVKSGFENYINLSGRATRSEYWYFLLFIFLGRMVIGFFTAITDLEGLINLWDIVVFLPHLSVAVRRLHDTNKSGWWVLLFITIIGLIPLIIWYTQKGNEEENRFGPNPLSNQPQS